MELTKIGSIVLTLAAAMHLTRIFFLPGLPELVPLWMSVLIAAGTIYLGVQYVKEHHSTVCYVTAGLFFLAGALHGYRVLLSNNVIALLPMWMSYVALPVTAVLAWLNYTE